jgi:hypothetical protein
VSIPCPVATCGRHYPGHTAICEACAGDLTRSLGNVPWLAVQLEVTLTRQARMGAGGKRGSEEPLAYDIRASEAAWVLKNTLVGWVRLLDDLNPPHGPVCDRCGHSSCAYVRLGRSPDDDLASIGRWLLARHDRIAGHAAAAEAVDEITSAVRSAIQVVDRPVELIFAGRCRCGTALYARPGATVVQCRDCDAAPVAVERQLERMRDELRDQLAHPAGAAALLARLDIRAPESTIRRWAKSGRILAHGADRKGRTLYRIGDILEVITEAGRVVRSGGRHG